MQQNEDGAAPANAPVDLLWIVTLVDAEAGIGHLELYEEARSQVIAADRILLSKMDLAHAKTLPYLHEIIEGLNGPAERAAFPGSVPDESVTAWLLDRHRLKSPFLATGHRPHKHSQLAALSFQSDRPLIGERLMSLCVELGGRLVRAKGFVDVAGEDSRGFLDRAGEHLSLRFDTPWPPGPRRTELVFIGEGLDAGALERRLWSLQVGAS